MGVMTVQRHFIGWERALTAKVCAFLLPSVTGPIDLEGDLVVVPTRNAGRRLREALARHCADHGAPLLSPRVVTPTFFIAPDDSGGAAASATAVAALWADVVLAVDMRRFPSLFPAPPAARDYAWALGFGQAVQQLRDTLAEGGRQIGTVAREFGAALEEPGRWRDLAALEEAFLQRLSALRLEDPCAVTIRCAADPQIPPTVRRIVVASVPDPQPLMLQALERLQKRVPIDILVYAPQELAASFDAWGRPLPERWRSQEIGLPEPERNLIVTGTPAEQSRRVLLEMAAAAPHIGPNDVAIGVPDPDVAAFLEADIKAAGLAAFNPAGRPLTEHPLFHLLAAMKRLAVEGSYTALTGLLRHPDGLQFFQLERGISPTELLIEIDRFRQEHLPVNWEDAAARLRPAAAGGRATNRYPALQSALEWVGQHMAALAGGDVVCALRGLLQALYASRSLRLPRRADLEFVQAAEIVAATLREMSGAGAESLRDDPRAALELLLARLSESVYELPRDAAAIDLSGWLELAWNDAPLMIVTGMNEGIVPDTRLGDLFLPDTLRVRLGLRSDATRLARDSYLMRCLIEARRQEGRICFLTGRTGANGDPRKPSRLLLQCADEQLPARVKQLCGPLPAGRAGVAASVSFRLDPGPPPDIDAARLTVSALHVTDFGRYLQCPFRFYLRRILDMEAVDIEQQALNPQAFGEMIHAALQALAADPAARAETDAAMVAAFLGAHAERWVRARYGAAPALPVLIQLEAARQRLTAAAQQQVALLAEGWDIVASELSIKGQVEGLTVSGRIDRVDRQRATQAIRILDYKTSEKAVDPAQAHLAPPLEDAPDYAVAALEKPQRWKDLQLPLYRRLLAEQPEYRGSCEVGYFNLPKAVSETGVALWPELTGALEESARVCAAGVVRDIRHRRFWPPALRVTWDDFESLFPQGIEACVAAGDFEKRLRT